MTLQQYINQGNSLDRVRVKYLNGQRIYILRNVSSERAKISTGKTTYVTKIDNLIVVGYEEHTLQFIQSGKMSILIERQCGKIVKKTMIKRKKGERNDKHLAFLYVNFLHNTTDSRTQAKKDLNRILDEIGHSKRTLKGVLFSHYLLQTCLSCEEAIKLWRSV